MIRLQSCTECGRRCFPPRALCPGCLSDAFAWTERDCAPGDLLATTLLHHSHEPEWREHLPLAVGLVAIDGWPPAVCFVAGGAVPGPVVVRADAQGRFVATPA